MLLLLREIMPEFEAVQRPEADIAAITGADVVEACAVRDKLLAELPRLAEEPIVDNPHAAAVAPIREAVDRYFETHPGSLYQALMCQNYSDEYRSLVISLVRSNAAATVPTAELSRVCGVPPAILEEWRRQAPEVPEAVSRRRRSRHRKSVRRRS